MTYTEMISKLHGMLDNTPFEDVCKIYNKVADMSGEPEIEHVYDGDDGPVRFVEVSK